MVYSLRAFRHYLLGGGALRPAGWTVFDLRTDSQAITWLKTNRRLNQMHVRRLGEIEDLRLDVTHLATRRSRCRAAASSTETAPRHGQASRTQRAGRDAPAPALGRHPRWVGAALANVPERDAFPSTPLRGGGR